MSQKQKWKLICNASAKLSVADAEATLRPGELVIQSGFYTSDAAFDALEALQERVDEINAGHCTTCE